MKIDKYMPNYGGLGELVAHEKRDHGGGLDAAIDRFGGDRIGWIDLSTGINPAPYPLPSLPSEAWTALPDEGALSALLSAARQFWQVPDCIEILATPGASSVIAQIPSLKRPGRVIIPQPTYNEHAAAFSNHGWQVTSDADVEAQVIVHPNNPDGRSWRIADLPARKAEMTIIDESFCDVLPSLSLIDHARTPGTLVLKSFGKFWGLAGVRLGFVMGDPDMIGTLRDRLGPWAVAGPALAIGAQALKDISWAAQTRIRLEEDSARLDALMQSAGAVVEGGTSLFRLYKVEDAAKWQHHLAQHHIWSRVFPYNNTWLRLGLPHPLQWPRLEAALK